jgi:glycosyltransferase involved in cell wall biosynthesis
MEPLVSIIIPVKNRIGWFSESFLPFHQQTYMNYEVIIVDDGSKPSLID